KDLIYVLYTLFFISCIVLIASVLLQPGKTDAGALFTSNISSSAFNPRGTATILAKITIVAASVFMVSAFLISLPALRGGVSVLDTVAEPVTETTAPSAVGDSNANSAPVSNANAAQPAANSAAPASNAIAEETGQERPAANN
ncbi:MAG TPA: preprotein translocase subunit SecG, partial [Blastocatellia bacterium]|nr:preprotein translocase subunit SecG [Blastocatellia bacterium]